jgi:hypothetical protein
LVTITALLAGSPFDEHFVPAAHQLDASRRNQPDTPLAGFQFTRNANAHEVSVNMWIRSKDGALRLTGPDANSKMGKIKNGQTCH